MAKVISFDFTDGDNKHYPVIVRIEDDLTDKQIDEIEDAMQSLIDKYVSDGGYWDCDDGLVCDVMNSFNYVWEFVCADRIVTCG